MSRFDDDYDNPDDAEGSEESDAHIRDLQAEIVRLNAELDQLAASVRERAAEAAVIAARLAELEIIVARLIAVRRRDRLFMRVTWAMIVASVLLSLYAIFIHLA